LSCVMTHMQRWCWFLVCNTGKGKLNWYNGHFQPLLTMTCFNSPIRSLMAPVLMLRTLTQHCT
jgi:hypothetical protein